MKQLRTYSGFRICASGFCLRLGMLAVYRLGGHIPTPGIDAERLEEFFRQNQGTLFGFFDLFSGGKFRRLTCSRWASCPTSRLDHSAADDGRGADAGKAPKRRRTRAPQDHAVDPLSDGDSGVGAVFGIATALQAIGRAISCVNPGFGFIFMTMLIADHRHSVHHVAG